MTGAGAPLRFLALIMAGWIAARAVLLWPAAETVVQEVARSPVSTPVARATARLVLPSPSPGGRVSVPIRTAAAPMVRLVLAPAAPRTLVLAAAPSDDGPDSVAQPASPARAALAMLTLLRFGPAVALANLQSGPLKGVAGAGTAPSVSRWSASSWLLARPGGGSASLAPVGSLGGAQAGVRLAYRPGFGGDRVELFGRFSSPLASRGAEAAAGVAVRPLRAMPVSVALEQRFGLERGAASGTSLSLFGGVSEVPVAAGFQLDGYAQAGVIGLRRRAGFADGGLSLTRPVAEWGDTRLSLGGGLWGAAQPGLSRFDVGPRAELRLPLAGRRVRMGVEWRQRVAGNAAPGSGPAVIVGSDF